MTKLSFFEAEVTLPVRIDHIVTKDLYYTLKLSSLDCSLCDTQIFYMRLRADLCVTCVERVIYLCQQEALYNDVDSEASTIIYNNNESSTQTANSFADQNNGLADKRPIERYCCTSFKRDKHRV